MTAARPTIALSESIHEKGLDHLRDHAIVHEFESIQQLVDARQVSHTDAIIVRSTAVDSQVMDRLPGLRVIGRHGAGLDNIDLDAARERGIKVVNTPHSNSHSVAEYVIGAIYSLLKRFTDTSGALRSGLFTTEGGSLPGQVHRMGLTGRELSSCTLGVVGYGAIGRLVADLAEANGMNVEFYDPFVSAETARLSHRHQHATLTELLAASDVVTLHVPGSPGQGPLIDHEEIRHMKPGSYVINAARGSIVSLDAVTSAVRSGHLAGAAIDVFPEEPPQLDAHTLAQSNILLTPHMAAMTNEALERMAVDVVSATLDAVMSVMSSEEGLHVESR